MPPVKKKPIKTPNTPCVQKAVHNIMKSKTKAQVTPKNIKQHVAIAYSEARKKCKR